MQSPQTPVHIMKASMCQALVIALTSCTTLDSFRFPRSALSTTGVRADQVGGSSSETSSLQYPDNGQCYHVSSSNEEVAAAVAADGADFIMHEQCTISCDNSQNDERAP